jgi:flagellin
MSLGVLNNLSAVYAENNLNNTNNSLNTVLQQLSSGSKINSGADDAAGLSLVDGLQANQMALNQSETNATEGAGLLQVADGALSQVTSLLNRAVTLATEASNGTLNSSQDTAANQEYQSILSEISNIGSTTTYNQEQVFNSDTNIYTGDSSTTGASIDSLNIRSLSSSNMGDTAGVMSYSNGSNNVFIDLSSGGVNAAETDSLGTASQTTTVAVNYMSTGANGSAVQSTANIVVGAGTTYANSVNGLMSAINNSGLGLTATFGTAASAGSASTNAATAANDSGGDATDTGIVISGVGVGSGSNTAGAIGTLSVGGSADTLGGSLSITDSAGATHALALGTANSTDTLANLASTINSAGYGITAAVNTSTVNGAAAGTVLTFTSAASGTAVTGTSLTDASTASTTITQPVFAGQTAALHAAGTVMATISTNAANQILGGGTLTLDQAFTGAATLAFTASMGDGTTTAGSAINLGVAGQTDTLANLANFINNNQTAGSNLQAVVSNNGTTLSVLAVNAYTPSGALNDAMSASLTVADTANATALTGTPSTTGAFKATIGTLTASTSADVFNGGSLTIGSNAAITLGVSAGTSKTDTLADLAATINANSYGVTATMNTANTVMTVTSANASDTFTFAGTSSTATQNKIQSTTAVANQNQIGTITQAGTAAGSLVAGDKILLNNGANVYTVNATDGITMANVAAGINKMGWGVTATDAGNATANTDTITFASTSAASLGTNVQFQESAAEAHVITTSSDNHSTVNSGYYKTGISGTVKDTSVSNASGSVGNGGTLNTGIVSNSNGSSGVATVSYSDAAGQSLSATDLSSQENAETALTDINKAITAVAAQDGYVGAQINTLDAVSSVLSTQSENVQSAQNAVQATDYASATSNMSKYEILSQTGIAALAQANSQQQDVLKLLQ